MRSGGQPSRQLLAELHAELVEGVDPPDDALHEYAVLAECDQGAQCEGVESRRQQGVAGPVARKGAVRNEGGVDAGRTGLVGRAPEREGLALGEAVREQQLVLMPGRMVTVGEADEVAGDEAGSLVEQLEEGVLSVRAGLPPDDRSGSDAEGPALPVDLLAVALHVELLQIGAGSAPEILVVGQHGVRALGAPGSLSYQMIEEPQDHAACSPRTPPSGSGHPSRAKPPSRLPEAIRPDRRS